MVEDYGSTRKYEPDDNGFPGPGNPGEDKEPSRWRFQNLAGLLEILQETIPTAEGPDTECIYYTRNKLTNILNLHHFLDRRIQLIFHQESIQRLVILRAKPNPCQGDRVFFSWDSPEDSPFMKKGFQLQAFVIDEGQSFIIGKPGTVELEEKGVWITLPEKGIELANRQTPRYPCPPFPIKVLQDGIVCPGRIVEFSVTAIELEMDETGDSSWNGFNPQLPVQLMIPLNGEILYAGEGQVIKETFRDRTKKIVIQMSRQKIQRVNRREFRSERVKIQPNPQLVFQHPIINRLIKIPVEDISLSGFSALEEFQATLMPGMILPQARVEFADSSHIFCRVQVIYSRRLEETLHQYGFFILDISAEDHLKLTNLVHRMLTPKIEINGPIDFTSLWALFFETGFINPQKYHLLYRGGKNFQEIFDKVYIRRPEIARHFVYQEGGNILGHVALLKVFEKAWMVHHLTARMDSRYRRVGLTLLYQVDRFINDAFILPSMGMNYIVSFFQPKNKFSNTVFGGAVRRIRDPEVVSLDPLAYLSYPEYLSAEPLPEHWVIKPAGPDDLEELEYVYQKQSGGLALEALDLKAALFTRDTLSPLYHAAGLQRIRKILAVKYQNELKAVLSVVVTDVGLNLSHLNNSILFFVLNPQAFPYEIFLKTLSWLNTQFSMSQIPIMIFPLDYAREQCIRYEKVYNLWVLKLVYSESYGRYLSEIYERYLKDVFLRVKLL